MNVTMPYSQAKAFHDIAFPHDSVLSNKIWHAVRQQMQDVTFNLTYSDYVLLTNILNGGRTRLHPEWLAELLLTLNKYTLPLLVEDASAVSP